MSLLQPDAGLVFWMFIAFGIVFFVLAKFAWPVIIGAADKRSAFITESINSAKEANNKLAGIKMEAERILSDADKQKVMMMQETTRSRDKIIYEAKEKAKAEAEKIIKDAQEQIRTQKNEMLSNYRHDVTEASIMIAESLLRRELQNKDEQIRLINSIFDEIKDKYQ